LSKAVKIKIYKTMVQPAVVYGSATWAMTDGYEKTGYRERKILKIYGPLVEQGIWKVRANQELRELSKGLDKVADIKRAGLECTGHLVRMDQGTTVKKIFESNPEGNSGRGRPRLRWLEELEKDVGEVNGSGDRKQSLGKNGRP